MNDGYILINSALRAEQYKTWQHPSASEIEDMAKGGFVKIGVESLHSVTPSERFWVRVSTINFKDKTVTGTVEQSDMLFGEAHGINHDDVLTVTFDQICATLPISCMPWLDPKEAIELSNIKVIKCN